MPGLDLIQDDVQSEQMDLEIDEEEERMSIEDDQSE